MNTNVIVQHKAKEKILAVFQVREGMLLLDWLINFSFLMMKMIQITNKSRYFLKRLKKAKLFSMYTLLKIT